MTFPLKLRPYQANIVKSISHYGSTLVVLPTGLGKTVIAFRVIWEALKKGKKALFLAPTKPLVEQHYKNFTQLFPEVRCALVTGEQNPKERQKAYGVDVIFATPQTVWNDLKEGLVLKPGVVIFDEAHRAVGNYAYVHIAKSLPTSTIRIGLTASPGGKKERIQEVLGNLGIENVEIRTPSSPDVAPYVKPIEMRWITTQLSPTQQKMQSLLKDLSRSLASDLAHMGIRVPLNQKRKLLEMQKELTALQPPYKFQVLLPYFMLVLAQHALELLETQGIYALKTFLKELEEKQGRSAKTFLKRPEVVKLKEMLEYCQEEHPKLKALLELCQKLSGKKIIVFTQYRVQVERIAEMLKASGIKAEIFLGKKKGFSQKKQREVIERFKRDEFDVLVSSSIGEEGLDIPGVDAVIFYEPVPSEIRAIQRRGRAGRFEKGEVYVLITKSTRDETFFWAAVQKEKRMRRILFALEKDKPKSARHNADENKKETVREKAEKESGQLALTEFL